MPAKKSETVVDLVSSDDEDEDVKMQVESVDKSKSEKPSSTSFGNSSSSSSSNSNSAAVIQKVHYTFPEKYKVGVRVVYEGWASPDYDEDILDDKRLARGGTHVLKYKGWIDLQRLPPWPCIVYDRPPVSNSKAGIDFLKTEKKVYIRLIGASIACIQPWYHGVWLPTKDIKPFNKLYETKFSEGAAFNRKDVLDHWVKTVEIAKSLSIDENGFEVLDHEFKFDGTFEMNVGQQKEAKLINRNNAEDKLNSM
eukprot:gene30899-38187_t